MSARSGRVALGDLETVNAVAALVDPRYRVLVQLLRRTALRWPEAVALRRRHCWVLEGTLEVTDELVETPQGLRLRAIREITGWVSVRDELREALLEHLEHHVRPERWALLFTDRRGGLLVRSRFEEEQWRPALRLAGLDDSWNLDDLASARLWEWRQETRRQRAALATGVGSDTASGWRRA